MSEDGSYYSFLPFLRTGIATKITGGTGASGRATVPVGLRLQADGGAPQDITKDVELYGPGDVIGIDPRAIVRTEPRSWVTNVEPNYLAHIEFYDEDFLWRYSPAGIDPETGRIRPWLALVVLAAGPDGADGGEFTDGAVTGRPLPFITVNNPNALPNPYKLGAWAHVHVNGPLADGVLADNKEAAMARFQQVLRTNADLACSRLLSPRHLLPSTGYHAFLVPSFEAGSRAWGWIPARRRRRSTRVGAAKTATTTRRKQPACRTTTAGTSAPAPKVTSRTWSGCCSRASRTPWSPGATSTPTTRRTHCSPASRPRPNRPAYCGSVAPCG
ncbi:hypothetical protein GCM10029976_089220 [Kribbella albertanoniae]